MRKLVKYRRVVWRKSWFVYFKYCLNTCNIQVLDVNDGILPAKMLQDNVVRSLCIIMLHNIRWIVYNRVSAKKMRFLTITSLLVNVETVQFKLKVLQPPIHRKKLLH